MAYFIRPLVKSLLLTAISTLVISVMPFVGLGENRYIGSERCGGCHPAEYKNFMAHAKKSKSFESIQKLRKGLTEKELKECYSCHTTGYGRPGGFESPEKTPHLKNAGCEVCHGPGEVHVKSMSRKDIKGRLTIKDCEVCHTPARVTAFRYKPLIHGGAH